MIGNQTFPIRSVNINGKSVVMCLPCAERQSELPEGVSSYAVGCNSGFLPRPLQGTVVTRSTIYRIWVSEVQVAIEEPDVNSHSSNKHGLPAFAHAAPCDWIQPLPQSYDVPQ
jgi:hypothetical protein